LSIARANPRIEFYVRGKQQLSATSMSKDVTRRFVVYTSLHTNAWIAVLEKESKAN
jgi:hypothetical protein